MEKTEALTQTINSSLKDLLEALSGPYFYIELSIIGVVITVACLLGMLVRGRVARLLERHPPRIDPQFITSPLVLLGPVLAFFALGVAKPFAEKYAEGSSWLTASMQLLVAYMMARIALLLIKSRAVAYFIAFVIMSIAVLKASGFMDSTEAALNAITFSLGDVKLSMLSLVKGIIMLVVVFWVASALSRALDSYLYRSTTLNYSTRLLFQKFFRILLYSIAFIVTLSAMGVDLTAFAVFGGALGVGIGLGLQQITSNFVSGVTLLMEKSIKIGDMVELEDVSGWVRQLNVRYTLIETFDGREIVVPNEQLISSRVTNWTHSNLRARVEFAVGVAYGSNVELVRRLILEAVTESGHALTDPAPACFLREFADSSLNFLVLFWVGDVRDGRYGPQSDVMDAILKKFEANAIEIPYPHQVHLEKRA